MLIEMLEYRLTPDGPFSRDYDYRAQAVALGARYRRQRRAWAPHVAQCHALIGRAVRSLPPGGRALVAGSGRLIEIPLDLLAAHFSEVVLLDIVHPLVTRRLARRHAHVRLISGDVTGCLGDLSAVLDTAGPLPDPHAMVPPLADARFDFALSANLASQLPLFPTNALEERRPDIDAATRERFGRRLIERHIDWLRQVGTVACLFTDIDSHWTDAQGREAERQPTLWGATLPPADCTWNWLIAPMPEEEAHYDLCHTVAGWLDLNRGEAGGGGPVPAP